MQTLAGPFVYGNAVSYKIRWAELEAAARKRGRSLTDELLGRLRASFARDREQKRDPAMRALSFLISQIAVPWVSAPGKPWVHNPFMFKTFKLGVAKLLDALEPAGQPRSPFADFKPGNLLFETYKTPESAADHLATAALRPLLQPRKLTEQDKAEIRAGTYEWPDFGDRLIEAIEDQSYGMADARHDLGIDKRKAR